MNSARLKEIMTVQSKAGVGRLELNFETAFDVVEALEQAEQAADELLTERDYWEKKLTDLVYALATVEEVGEWSSMNDISDNLIKHIGGKIQKLEKATERVRELLSYYKVDSPLARVAIRALDGDGRG